MLFDILGRDFCERLWTVIATCSLQKRSAYHWIHAVIGAHFNGRPVPSLLLVLGADLCDQALNFCEGLERIKLMRRASTEVIGLFPLRKQVARRVQLEATVTCLQPLAISQQLLDVESLPETDADFFCQRLHLPPAPRCG